MPREGLPNGLGDSFPPCLRIVAFEGRVATFYDEMACDHKDAPSMSTRCEVLIGEPTEWLPWAHADHPETVVPSAWVPSRRRLGTDDPDEAQAAYERGAEWVLTGKGP